MEIPTQISNVSKIQDELKQGEIIAAVIGFAFLAVTIYSFSLSIKVNRLNLRQLKDNGYF